MRQFATIRFDQMESISRRVFAMIFIESGLPASICVRRRNISGIEMMKLFRPFEAERGGEIKCGDRGVIVT